MARSFCPLYQMTYLQIAVHKSLKKLNQPTKKMKKKEIKRKNPHKKKNPNQPTQK